LYLQQVLTEVAIHEGRAGRGVRVSEEERVTGGDGALVFVRRGTVIIYPTRLDSGDEQ
jgi:hypothetical protein